jgi:hypothetical protein
MLTYHSKKTHTVSVKFSAFDWFNQNDENNEISVGFSSWSPIMATVATEGTNVVWDSDTIPRTAVSNDGVALVHHIPRAFDEHETQKYTAILIQYATNTGIDPPGKGADSKGRNNSADYVKRKGENNGLVKIVRAWHAIGHPVSLSMVYLTHFQVSLLI